ncbi:hypothetical protein [Paludibaculum fermentans]|uniref:Uncharacterized protein n=1 Tax=Paludibaculum fermentans TaxID=1473598 RepID=A0A7S7NSB0_PALFE|nr:hypothetical protein [Paludibaculum fermentans]QOY88908.1 hypothetical protein IRI77_02800 [Paludibaculum fermentans]
MPRPALLLVHLCLLSSCALSAQTPVLPGKAVNFSLPAVQNATLFHGDYSHLLHVPATATSATVEIRSTLAEVDVDLHVRFGTDTEVAGGAIVSDYSSVGLTAAERIVIDGSASPPLRAGDYYISYAVYTKGVEIPLTLTVTLAGESTEPVALVTSDIPDPCLLTASRDFTLAQAARIRRVLALYQWETDEAQVDYTILRGPVAVTSGSLARGACVSEGSSWCLAEADADVTLPSGPYRLQLAQPQACSAADAGPAVVAIYGDLLPAPSWRPLAETVAGPDGGVIEAGLSIQVPAGALAAPVPVRVATLDTTEPASPQRLSAIYQLEGLGLNQSRPISISIPLTAAPQGALTIVWSTSMPAGLTTPQGVRLLPASYENGRAVAELPAVDLGSAEDGVSATSNSKRRSALVDPTSLTSRLYVLGGFAEVGSPSGRFVIHYPVSGDAVQEIAEETGIFLDSVEARLKTMAVDTSRRTSRIDVYLASPNGTEGSLFGLNSTSGDPINGVTESDIWGAANVGYVLNLNFATDRENFHITAAHELLHVYQAAFDPRNVSLRRAVTDSPWLWLLEATPTWLERAFSDHPDKFTPTEAVHHRFYAFRHGLNYSTAFDTTDNYHGYGAASLIEYLAPVQSPKANFLGKLMEQFAASKGILLTTNRYSTLEAIRNLTGEPWITLWPGYFAELLEGRIYPAISVYKSSGVTGSMLAFQSDPEVMKSTFSLAGDTAKAQTFAFPWQAPPLSAALMYGVVPARSALPAGARLTYRFLTASSGDYFFLYHFDGKTGQTTRLYHGSAPFTIDNLASLATDATTELYAFILNAEDQPDAGATCNQREFQAIYDPGTPNPLIKATGVSVRVNALPTFVDPVTKGTTDSFIGWNEFITNAHCGSNAVRNNSWSGTTFNVVADCDGRMGGEDNPVGVAHTTATVKMNPSFTAIDQLQMNQTLTVRTSNHVGEYRKTTSICLQNLPPDDTVKYKSYVQTVPSADAPGKVCGIEIKREALNGEAVTNTLILKSLEWPAAASLRVEIQ